jgi:S1-C subfamily serine protease
MTYDKSYIPLSQGSGFFINKNTLITNYHVIEGSHSVELKVIGEDDFIRGAKIILASKKHDIAIIETKKEYSFFKIDSLDTESIGSKIYTIGNPRGLEGTISEGIISAKRKEDYDLIQITAPISPGNSGGPLINKKGDVTKDEAINEIKQLKELLDSGILTQEEFDKKAAELKKIILGN